MQKFKLISTGDDRYPFWLASHSGATSYYKKNELGEYYLLITGRDEYNRSVIGRATWSVNQPDTIYNFESEPVLELGPAGSFYDCGTSYPFVTKIGDKTVMYFTGWSRGGTVPFYNDIGVAVLNIKKGMFEVVSHAPLFKKSEIEYLGFGSMCVFNIEDTYSMIYANFKNWVSTPKKFYHEYSLFKRNSKDGFQWDNRGTEIKIPSDFQYDNICKPVVVKDHIYFCARKKYRLFHFLG